MRGARSLPTLRTEAPLSPLPVHSVAKSIMLNAQPKTPAAPPRLTRCAISRHPSALKGSPQPFRQSRERVDLAPSSDART